MISCTRLNTEKAAQYIREDYSPKMLETLRIHGGGPAFLEVGKRVYYETSDLDAWLANKRRASTTVAAPAAPQQSRAVLIS